MTRAPQTLIDDLTLIRQWSQGGRQVPYPEIDTINVVIGDGVNVLVAGVTAALRVDFNALITGSYIHEFDGVTGSVVLGIAKAAYVIGSAPTFTSIVASAPPTVTSARYGVDETLTGWTRQINRGDVLRFSVTSAATITRILLALRVRRLEP
jgi:hypothetical protein